MLNSRSSSVINQNIKFNAVSGTMFKSCSQSFFSRFHLESKQADTLFQQEPFIWVKKSPSGYSTTKLPVVVLQTMLVGDMEVMAEIITKEDYDSLNREEHIADD